MKDSPSSSHIASPAVGCSARHLPSCESEKRFPCRSESFINARSFTSDWEIITLYPKNNSVEDISDDVISLKTILYQ